MLLPAKKIGNKKRGQALIEYTFCMVAVCLLLIGMIEVFSWMARDLVKRRHAHEATLAVDIGHDQAGPLEQLAPLFYTTSPMKGVPIMSNIYGSDY